MVSIVSVPRAGWYRFRVLVGEKIFLYSKTTRLSLGLTQPSDKGYWGSVLRLNWPVPEVNHCSPSSSEVIVELYVYSHRYS